jgi:S1-C subfamily serine protease
VSSSILAQASGEGDIMESIWKQLSREIAAHVAEIGRSVVAVDGRSGHTSAGIVWRPDAVLTAAHTIRREEQIAIISESGKSVTARVAGRATGAGIALLKLDKQIDVPPARLAASAALSIGELVIAIARTRRGNIVASSGILGGLMGEWDVAGTRIDQFIRPDLTLYSGFSGGALISSDGGCVGMVTGGILRGKAITIPASTLTRVADELLAKGHLPAPYIGVAMQPVDIPESLQQLSSVNAPAGLLVMHVEPGGPADLAGILLGDIVVDLDGTPSGDPDDLHNILHTRGVNQQLQAGLIRGGKKIQLAVKVGERPLR